METKTQDPKYIIIDGALANAESREFIPEDEPIFIIRGKDIHAIGALINYAYMCQNTEHQEAVDKRVGDFNAFAVKNPDRMNEPDTAGADSWPESHD